MYFNLQQARKNVIFNKKIMLTSICIKMFSQKCFLHFSITNV